MLEKARETGRKQADKLIKKADPIFARLKLNSDDAKVVFHPLDYEVFNGMKAKDLRSLTILHSKEKPKDLLPVQESVINTIAKGNYDCLTMNVEIGGKHCNKIVCIRRFLRISQFVKKYMLCFFIFCSSLTLYSLS